MDLAELIARESIRDIVARYNASADSGRFDETLALFAPDASMYTPGQEYHGIDGIETLFRGTQDVVTSAGAGAPQQPKLLRHHVATHIINMIDAHNATGRSYFSVYTAAGVDHWGVYADTYRADDGVWRFTERRVRVDGYAPDSIFEQP